MCWHYSGETVDDGCRPRLAVSWRWQELNLRPLRHNATNLMRPCALEVKIIAVLLQAKCSPAELQPLVLVVSRQSADVSDRAGCAQRSCCRRGRRDRARTSRSCSGAFRRAPCEPAARAADSSWGRDHSWCSHSSCVVSFGRFPDDSNRYYKPKKNICQ